MISKILDILASTHCRVCFWSPRLPTRGPQTCYVLRLSARRFCYIESAFELSGNGNFRSSYAARSRHEVEQRKQQDCSLDQRQYSTRFAPTFGYVGERKPWQRCIKADEIGCENSHSHPRALPLDDTWSAGRKTQDVGRPSKEATKPQSRRFIRTAHIYLHTIRTSLSLAPLCT